MNGRDVEPSLPSLEEAYRRHFLRNDAVQASAAIVVWNILSVFSLRSDYLLFGTSAQFYWLLAARGAVLVLGVLAVLYLNRTAEPRGFDRTMWIVLGAVVLFTLAIHLGRTGANSARLPLDILLVFGFYLAVPVTFVTRLSAALVFTVGALLVYLGQSGPPSAGVAAAYLGANALGLFASIQLRGHRRRLYQTQARTAEQREELRRLTTTDTLTGVANRRELIQRGLDEFGRARRYNRSFAILIMDIDDFKAVNDTHGHTAADDVLRQFAQLVAGRKRKQDIFGRLGGQEFALMLPETRLTDAVTVAERLRQLFNETTFTVPGGEARITLSMGLVERTDGDTTFDTLRKRADEVLYRAKQSGRNSLLWA